MKNGKRLTREMKMLLIKNGYQAEDYLFIKNTTNFIEFVHRTSGRKVLIEKNVK